MKHSDALLGRQLRVRLNDEQAAWLRCAANNRDGRGRGVSTIVRRVIQEARLRDDLVARLDKNLGEYQWIGR